MEPWAAAKRDLCQCHQLLSGLLANGPLLRVPRQSRLSANDNDDNEVKPVDLHRSPGMCLAA